MKKIIVVFGFILLIFLSIVPRSVELLNGNYLFGFDQGRDYLAAWSIAKDFKPTLIGSEFGAGSAGFRGLFHGPFHFYLLAISVFLFDGDPYGGIVYMFFFGIAAIWVGYLLGNQVFKSGWGLFLALLFAISPPLISASRFVWNSNPSPVFILLVMYFVYKSIQQKGKYIFFAAFFAAFIYNFQTGIAVPLCLSLLIFYLFIVRLNTVKEYLFMISGFIGAISPFIFFEIRHSFMGINGMINYLFYDEKTQVTLFFIQRILYEHFNEYVYNFSLSFPTINNILFMSIAIILFASFIYFFVSEKDTHLRRFIVFLLLQPFISFFVFAFLKNNVYSYYLIHLNIVYLFIFAYTVISAMKKKNRLFMSLHVVVCIILFVTALHFSISNFISDYNDYGGTAKIKGKLDAIDYLYKDADKKSFGIIVFSPPIYTYPYDYLIKWYGNKKYGYIPHSEKDGLYYLLIEKDFSKPWSYKGWIETVIGNDKVLFEKKLPSGFIVQKRFHE